MTDLVFFYGTLMSGFRRPGRANLDRVLKPIGRGSISAALFLREFVGNVQNWVHCDIAGPAMGDRMRGWDPKGGTGHGVLTFLGLIESATTGTGVAAAPLPKGTETVTRQTKSEGTKTAAARARPTPRTSGKRKAR